MKKAYILTVLMLVLSLFAISNDKAWDIRLEKGEAEKMPKFSYRTLEGRKFTNKDLKKNRVHLFVYFNPLCHLCQEETGDMLGNLQDMKEVEIVMVSPADISEIRKFADHFNLKNIPQILVLADPDDRFYIEFGAIGYPNMYVYGMDDELIAYFDSKIDFREVTKVIKPLSRK